MKDAIIAVGMILWFAYPFGVVFFEGQDLLAAFLIIVGSVWVLLDKARQGI